MSRKKLDWSTRFTVGATPYGQGVFAAKRFRTGEVVTLLEGEIIRDAGYSSDYCIDLGRGRVLEPTAPYQYLNHCCEPNCELTIESARAAGTRTPQVYLETLRPIRPGEQLTIDYAWPAEAAIPCLCGHKNCRGWIVDAEQLGELPEGDTLSA